MAKTVKAPAKFLSPYYFWQIGHDFEKRAVEAEQYNIPKHICRQLAMAGHQLKMCADQLKKANDKLRRRAYGKTRR